MRKQHGWMRLFYWTDWENWFNQCTYSLWCDLAATAGGAAARRDFNKQTKLGLNKQLTRLWVINQSVHLVIHFFPLEIQLWLIFYTPFTPPRKKVISDRSPLFRCRQPGDDSIAAVRVKISQQWMSLSSFALEIIQPCWDVFREHDNCSVRFPPDDTTSEEKSFLHIETH